MRSRTWIGLALILSGCGRADEAVDIVRSWLPGQSPRIGAPLRSPSTGTHASCFYRIQPSVIRAEDLDDPSLDPMDPLTTVFAVPRIGAKSAITKLESELGTRPDFLASAIVNARVVVVKARPDLLKWTRDRLAALEASAPDDHAGGTSSGLSVDDRDAASEGDSAIITR